MKTIGKSYIIHWTTLHHCYKLWLDSSLRYMALHTCGCRRPMWNGCRLGMLDEGDTRRRDWKHNDVRDWGRGGKRRGVVLLHLRPPIVPTASPTLWFPRPHPLVHAILSPPFSPSSMSLSSYNLCAMSIPSPHLILFLISHTCFYTSEMHIHFMHAKLV